MQKKKAAYPVHPHENALTAALTAQKSTDAVEKRTDASAQKIALKIALKIAQLDKPADILNDLDDLFEVLIGDRIFDSTHIWKPPPPPPPLPPQQQILKILRESTDPQGLTTHTIAKETGLEKETVRAEIEQLLLCRFVEKTKSGQGWQRFVATPESDLTF